MTRYRWVRADGSLRGYIWAPSRSAAYAMRRVRAGEFVTGDGERTPVARYLAASRIVADGHGYPKWTERKPLRERRIVVALRQHFASAPQVTRA